MDIVEHLRACAHNLSLDLGAGNCNGAGWREMMNTFADAADEIERLRFDLSCEQEEKKELSQQLTSAQIEISAMKDHVRAVVSDLAEAHKETDSVVYARDEAYRMLAECERERDALLHCQIDALEEAKEQLATVTKERDELEGLLRDSQCEHKRCMDALDAVMRDPRNAPIGEAALAKLGADKGE